MEKKKQFTIQLIHQLQYRLITISSCKLIIVNKARTKGNEQKKQYGEVLSLIQLHHTEPITKQFSQPQSIISKSLLTRYRYTHPL